MRRKLEIISQRLYLQSQSWYFERSMRVTNPKGDKTEVTKIEIRRNAYDNQSYARAYVWDRDARKWNLVVDAPITECECRDISYVQKDVTPNHFEADYNRLFVELCKVIGI